MNDSDLTDWPPLESAYEDEHGRVEPEVYRAAGELWRSHAARLAGEALQDTAEGRRLMLKAAASVSRVYRRDGGHIENLAAYLYTTYKRLVLAEQQKRAGHRRHEAALYDEAAAVPDTTAADLDLKIEFNILWQRMDEWMRRVTALRIQQYTFEEIAAGLGEQAHRLRSRYDKRFKRLLKERQAEIEAAERKRARANRSWAGRAGEGR